jgi:glycosyltransferase involved in cell wall biosynthesis
MENVVASLLRALPSTRYVSEAWCLEELDALGHELRRTGATLFEFRKRRSREPRLFWTLARAIRTRRVELLHCHDELSWFYGAVAARLAGVRRIVITMHGRRPGIVGRHLIEQRVLAALTPTIVAVSAFLREQILHELRVPASQVVLVRNGIVMPPPVTPEQRRRSRAALGLAASDFVVGTVGELSPVKNIALALDGVARAHREVPLLKYLVIGGGAQHEALTAKAAELGLTAAVRFLGVRRDVPELLAALDAYVCSSNYEGISLSILEAMAAGTPIVATMVGGNPELIQHGRTGLLIPSGDATALGEALRQLANQAAAARQIALQARLAVEQAYTIDRMIDAYDSLYRFLVERDGGASSRAAI